MIEWTKKPHKRGTKKPKQGGPCKACGKPTGAPENDLCYRCHTTARSADETASQIGGIRLEMRDAQLNVDRRK